MARKFTEEEQKCATALAKTLAAALPPVHRSKASGIASGLVRLRSTSLSTTQAREVLEKYGAGPDVAAALAHAGVWTRTAEGEYNISPALLTTAEHDAGNPAARNGADRQPAGQGTNSQPEKPGADQAAQDTEQEAAGPAADRPAGGRTVGRQPTALAAAADKPATSRGNKAGKHVISNYGNAAKVAASSTGATGMGKADVSSPGKTGPAGKAGTRKAHAQANRPRLLGRLSAVRKQTPELTDVRRRIIDLDPRLWINGYLLSTPDAFLDYEPQLNALSAALDRSAAIGDGTLTLRELSYQVFGDEKFLAIESEGRKLLRFMGVADLLRYRTVGKTDMVHFIPRHRKRPRLLLSENLDPWANVRDALFLQGRTRIMGKRVDGAVFGNGHLAMGSHQLADLAATLAAEEVRVLYWGDLDRAGLSILARVAQEARDGKDAQETPITVKPFMPAYRLMLKRAMKRCPNPLDNKPTDQTEPADEGFALIAPHLKEREAAYLQAVLDGARLIPQEIVTAADL